MTAKQLTETETLFKLDKPSLENLSYVLRHPETWPEGFIWNYAHCSQCAMGLAYELWNIAKPDNAGYVDVGCSTMARAFGISYSATEDIFFDANVSRGDTAEVIIKTGPFGWGKPLIREKFIPFDRTDITPEMIADDIDAYLASRS